MSRSNPYDLSEGRKGFKSGIREHCQCQYCEHQRQEEAQGPRPGWLQREFDAARKATAPPAAGPWIKIEPGGEMPEDDRHCLVIHSGGVGLCEYDEGRWWHVYEGDGVSGPTHYAVVRMPEGK